jgi:hypothetical protein
MTGAKTGGRSLPLRAFDQRHGLTLSLEEPVRDPREVERARHSVLSHTASASNRILVALRTHPDTLCTLESAARGP